VITLFGLLAPYPTHHVLIPINVLIISTSLLWYASPMFVCVVVALLTSVLSKSGARDDHQACVSVRVNFANHVKAAVACMLSPRNLGRRDQRFQNYR
jgi:hypothetical protein